MTLPHVLTFTQKRHVSISQRTMNTQMVLKWPQEIFVICFNPLLEAKRTNLEQNKGLFAISNSSFITYWTIICTFWEVLKHSLQSPELGMISWNLQTTYTLLCQAPWCIRHDELKLTRLCMLHTTQKTSGRFSLQLLIKQLNQGTLGTRVIQTLCLIQDDSSIMQSWWHLHKIWVEIISNN
jgi:hypothetical protein